MACSQRATSAVGSTGPSGRERSSGSGTTLKPTVRAGELLPTRGGGGPVWTFSNTSRDVVPS